jgi:citrate synthase
MDVMRTGISMLGVYDPTALRDQGPEANRDRARSITAKIGVIAAYFSPCPPGQVAPPVRGDLAEAAHFLYLINGEAPQQEAA